MGIWNYKCTACGKKQFESLIKHGEGVGTKKTIYDRSLQVRVADVVMGGAK